MGRFVVYEIWTRSKIIEAENIHDAYDKGEPKPENDLSLANWHVVSLDEPMEEPTGTVGGLNYRQLTSE